MVIGRVNLRTAKAQMREQIDAHLKKLIKETTDPDDIDLNTEGGDTDGLEGLAPKKINVKERKPKITIQKKRKPKKSKNGGGQGGGNPPPKKGLAGGGNQGEKVLGHSLRCLLSARNASSCTYRIPLPKGIPAGTTTISVEAIGFDGSNMEIEITNPDKGVMQLTGAEQSVEIEVKGGSMALQATLTQKPSAK